AIKKISKDKVSITEAANLFSIPRKTVWNRLKGICSSRHGMPTVLTKETENDLAEWILDCSSKGDPRTKHQILKAAEQLSRLENENTSGFRNGTPSYKWLRGFLKRHPNISRRTPSKISRASGCVSGNDITKFLRDTRDWLIEKLGEDNYIALANDPLSWGNCDETGFDLNPSGSVYARKGGKSVYQIETAKPKERISVMYTFLASGDVLRPQLILKNSISRITDIAMAAGEVGANYIISQTEKGWQTQESFFEYVTDKVMIPETIRKGFNETGVFPLDPTKARVERCVGITRDRGKTFVPIWQMKICCGFESNSKS
ncbi:CLUMA_CG015792, isoform A, partial [Clunio marinus]